MADIQVGDKVRILANENVKGHRWDPSNPSKHLKSIKAEDLKDKHGIVIPIMRELPDVEVFVKLDKGWTGDYSEALLVTF